MTQDGTDVDADFSVLNSKDLLTASVDELKELVTKRRNMTEEERAAEREKEEKEMRAKAAANGIKIENGVEKEVKSDDVTILDGHTGEVFICAWNPAKGILSERKRRQHGARVDGAGWTVWTGHASEIGQAKGA